MDVSAGSYHHQQQLKTSGIRDSLCSLDPITIPRPKFTGMEYVPTMGRFGYYQSLRRRETEAKKNLANIFPPDYDLPTTPKKSAIDDGNRPVEFRRLGENFQKIPVDTKTTLKSTEDRVDGKTYAKPHKNTPVKKEVKFADSAELVK